MVCWPAGNEYNEKIWFLSLIAFDTFGFGHLHLVSASSPSSHRIILQFFKIQVLDLILVDN